MNQETGIAAEPAVPNPARLVKIPLRWVGHGDLNVIDRDGIPALAAYDVIRLCGLDIPSGDNDGSLLSAEPWWSIEQTRAQLEHSAPPLGDEFLEWVMSELELTEWHSMVEASTSTPPPGRTMTIKAAAELLSNPNLDIGQKRLFQRLAGMDWIFRDLTGVWRPADESIRLGRLSVLHKRVQGELYPEIVVTARGLDDLRSVLGQPHPTLMEVDQ